MCQAIITATVVKSVQMSNRITYLKIETDILVSVKAMYVADVNPVCSNVADFAFSQLCLSFFLSFCFAGRI